MRRRSNFIVHRESIFRRTTADDLVAILVRYVVFALVAALALGLTANLTAWVYLRNAPFDYRQLAALPLNLALGYLLALGVVLPAIFAFLVQTLRKELVDGRVRSLRFAFSLYLAGVVLAAALMFYQGFLFVVLFGSDPIFPLEGIGDQLFGGNPILRYGLNSLAAFLLAVGLLWFLTVIFRARQR